VIIKTRYELTKQGYSPNFYQSLQKNIQKEGNPFGMPQEDRVLWYEDTADEFRYSSNKSLFWPGCNTSYRLPEIVESTSNIFSKASLDFGILGNNESCCGLIFYLMGYWEKAKECAEKILNQLKEDTPENIITSCAGCFYAFKKVYKSLGINLPFNVLHTSQIFEKILSNERFSIKPLRKTILWHDPCDLGRHCNVYDPPRKVLRNIPEMKLIEPFLTKQHNVCCGAGGGLWMYDEKLTINVSHQKLIETVPSNLDSIVTGCPSCILNLRNAARQIRKNLQIFDLSEILDNCLK
jgi:glycolate oxidase